MKDRSSPSSPVAVCHSDKSCCKHRTMCPIGNGSGVVSECPGHPGPVGARLLTLPAPQLASTLSTDGTLWRFRVMEGEPECTENAWFSAGVEGHMSFVSLSLWGTARNRGEVMMVLCFGRTLLPKWKLHFWLSPLLSLWWKAVHSMSGPWRSGLARPGLVLFGPVSGKPCHPGLLSEAGFGRRLPSLLRRSAPRAPILESSLTSSGVPVQAAVLGSHPFPRQFARKPCWWVPRYRQVPRRCTPCPRHCCYPGEVGG